MKRIFTVLFFVSFIFSPEVLFAQCDRSGSYYGEMVPDAGCGVFRNYSPYGPGEYFRMPVLQGGSYSISTCNSPGLDAQLTCY